MEIAVQADLKTEVKALQVACQRQRLSFSSRAASCRSIKERTNATHTAGQSTVRREMAKSCCFAKVRLRPLAKTVWADYCVVDDDLLADEHFEIKCASGDCFLRTRAAEPPTLVNGIPVCETKLEDGDEVHVGNTSFKVQVFGQHLERPEEKAGNASADESEIGDGEKDLSSAQQLVSLLELSEEAEATVDEDMNEVAFLTKLLDKELFKDATTVAAYLLGKTKAVQWATECVQNVCTDVKKDPSNSFSAATQWASDPSEDNRRNAERAANGGKSGDPTTWLALRSILQRW